MDELTRLRAERLRYENAQCVTCAKHLDTAALPAEDRAVTAPQEPEPPFDDWASHIATDVDSKSDSQLEWEINEALQKAYRHGQAKVSALTHAIEALRGEMEQIGTECSLDAWDSCWSKRVLTWAAILKEWEGRHA